MFRSALPVLSFELGARAATADRGAQRARGGAVGDAHRRGAVLDAQHSVAGGLAEHALERGEVESWLTRRRYSERTIGLPPNIASSAFIIILTQLRFPDLRTSSYSLPAFLSSHRTTRSTLGPKQRCWEVIHCCTG